jgi:hypothetical protein
MELRREAEEQWRRISTILDGHNPAAVANALMMALAHLITHNAIDPAAMAQALGSNLMLAVGSRDEEDRSLGNQSAELGNLIGLKRS